MLIQSIIEKLDLIKYELLGYLIGIFVAELVVVLFAYNFANKPRGKPAVYAAILFSSFLTALPLCIIHPLLAFPPAAVLVFGPLTYMIFFTGSTVQNRKQRKAERNTAKYFRTVTLYEKDSVSVEYKSTYAPPIPKRTGYNFGGWFVDTALSVPWKSTDRVLCDMTLYPKWIKE